jgi:cysteinyl-tRNA synthetase
MEYRLTNTLSGEKEPVYAQDGQSLRFYCCGPTVYGPAHIGNFRTFLVQDVFRRTAEVLGFTTCHVRNTTDVDDKTIRRSQEEGKTLAAFTKHWTDRFHADCEALNLLNPHVEPSAIEHIPEQIALIEKLVAKGHAYQASDGSVYYRISSFPSYGKLSGLKKQELRGNADGRLNLSDEYAKEDFSDFALWKAWKPEDGDNRWDSPWGPGRPGWHIECSAMSMKYLGQSFDLHSGGVDLVFPHHENEIAQSEAATGQTFVRHWFHAAHLQVQGAKMSKSLGNLYTLEDIQAQGFSAEELRYTLISGHYRQPLNFTWDSLRAARSALSKLRRYKELMGPLPEVRLPGSSQTGAFAPVLEALADDLNVAKALGVLFTILAQSEGSMQTIASPVNTASFAQVLYALGLTLDDPAEQPTVTIPEAIQALADARWQARLDRNWALADTLRKQLADQGWLVKDAKEDYTLSPQ